MCFTIGCTNFNASTSQLGVPHPSINNPIVSLSMAPLCNPTLVPLFLPTSFIAYPPPRFPPPKPSLGNPIPLLLGEAHTPNNLHIIITKISILEQLEFSVLAQHASSCNGQTVKGHVSIPWGTHVFLGAFMPSPPSKPSTPYKTFCSKLGNIDIF